MCAGSRPEAQEVLTATRFGDHQVALKSGYDKYVSVEKSGRLTARADAISSQELWQAVFQDVRVTLVNSHTFLISHYCQHCCLYSVVCTCLHCLGRCRARRPYWGPTTASCPSQTREKSVVLASKWENTRC